MKMKKIACLLLATILFSLPANGKLPIFVERVPDLSVLPNSIPAKGEARIYTTTADGTLRLNEKTIKVSNGHEITPLMIYIDGSKRYQSIDGFGFAITYSTCYNLLHMPEKARSEFLRRTYSPTEGYGVSYARISIGCNDFSSREYTLCDKEGIDNFSLQSDEIEYVIPILKEILAINPKVKIIAAPWTCPKWMKVGDIRAKKPFDSWTDGHLNPDGTYAAVILNSGDTAVSVTLFDGTKSFVCPVPAKGVASCRWWR